jgi:AcrR family transcriptional regulator
MTKPVKQQAVRKTSGKKTSAKTSSKKPAKKPAKKRTYSSAVRADQAARTRARIVEAAGELFESAGYARTTVREIAERADVATDTVYAVFGSKGRVLTALIDARLAPSGDVDNVTDRPEAQAVRDEPDQRRQIELFAHDMATVSVAVRPVFEMLRTASAVEPEMATIRAEMDGYRLQNMRRVVEWIAAHGPLRLGIDEAAEVTWTVTSPDVGAMLCTGRGWSTERYADWLADVLIRTLLPD